MQLAIRNSQFATLIFATRILLTFYYVPYKSINCRSTLDNSLHMASKNTHVYVEADQKLLVN